MLATAAMAADLPTPPVAAAPPPLPMAAPGFNWDGFYVGAFGGTWYCVAVPIELGLHVGYNFVPGRMLFGAEAGVGMLFPGAPFSVAARGRIGFVVGDRVLLYGVAGIEKIFVPVSLFWTAGGGAELALGDRLSLFCEAGVIAAFGGGLVQLVVRGGLNFHR